MTRRRVASIDALRAAPKVAAAAVIRRFSVASNSEYLSVPNLATLWLLAAVPAVPLYLPTRAFARWKRRRRDLAWPRYF